MSKKQVANQELEAKLAELRKVYQECKDIALKNELTFIVDLENVGREYGYTFDGGFSEGSISWQIYEIENDNELSREQKDEKIKEIKENYKGQVHWHNSTVSCELGGY
jgi:hypothetical protein